MGPYEILFPLGAGGMGEVYLARDTRLGREVAVKVLPEGLGGDPERLKRFEKEARSTSALNHPNIVTIHEIGSVGGVSYIAMEHVEGSTLRELLDGGPLPTKKILSIAAQVAEGLAKAHAAGIVHRDLKPENLMVTPDGLVKILDFGLAKLTGPPEASAEATGAPTVSKGTEPGVVMGTVAYMSPEQATGKPLDFRSDQFSLGAVLYEMAAGRRPFDRPTRPETLTAILRDEPEPLSSVAPATPAPLRWIVERCLAKDPEERYASTRDLAFDLSQAATRFTSISAPGPAAPAPPQRKRALASTALVLLGVTLGLLAAGVAVRVRGPGRTEASPRLTRATSSPGLQEHPAFSPDGRFLAYVTDERGNLDIVVQPRGGGAPIRVAETDADEAQPAWSPDGTRIAFCSARDHGGRLAFALGQVLLTPVDGRGGDLFIVPALGGAAVKLVEDGYYPAWSPDGKRIVFQSNRGAKWDLWTISAEGGQPQQLTNDAEFNYQPSWSPDGRWIAYCSGTRGVTNVRVVPAAGGAPVQVTHGETFVLHPSWTPYGQSIVYSTFDSVTNVWELPFSNGRAAASPRRITLGGGEDVDAAVSRDGRYIAFATTRTNGDIWEMSLPSGALRQVTSETTQEEFPELSPDGKTLLAESDRKGESAIWTLDLSGRFHEQVSPGGASHGHWSPDGRQVSYILGGRIRIHPLGNVSGVDTGVRVGSGSAPFSPDGTMLSFVAPGDPALSLCTISSRAVRRLGAVPGTSLPGDATWSPDASALVANVQKETARELWIFPVDGSPPKRLTHGESEDSHPRWSPVNADEILFLRDHRRLCVVSVSTGRIRELSLQQDGTFFLDYPSWTRDGKRVFFSIHKKTGNIYVIER